MPLTLKDRVRETSEVTGTGEATLLGAVDGFQSFEVVGDGNTCYYVIADQAGPNWEIGVGIYTLAGTSLLRTNVLASSNGGSLVDFSTGVKDVFVTYPASKAAYVDEQGYLFPTLKTTNDASISGVTVGSGSGTSLRNVAIGGFALHLNETSSQNTAIGWYALYLNATGGSNTAVGTNSLISNTEGGSNTAVGTNSLTSNSTAHNNTAVGVSTLRFSTTGGDNTAIGGYSLYSNTTGVFNVAVGSGALFANTVGRYNVACGYDALRSIATGEYNTAIGSSSGLQITTGSKNTILGNFNGNQHGLDIRELSNYLVLSDGDGYPRIYHNGATVVIPNLPTSATGLAAGSLWKDENGFLKVA